MNISNQIQQPYKPLFQQILESHASRGEPSDLDKLPLVVIGEIAKYWTKIDYYAFSSCSRDIKRISSQTAVLTALFQHTFKVNEVLISSVLQEEATPSKTKYCILDFANLISKQLDQLNLEFDFDYPPERTLPLIEHIVKQYPNCKHISFYAMKMNVGLMSPILQAFSANNLHSCHFESRCVPYSDPDESSYHVLDCANLPSSLKNVTLDHFNIINVKEWVPHSLNSLKIDGCLVKISDIFDLLVVSDSSLRIFAYKNNKHIDLEGAATSIDSNNLLNTNLNKLTKCSKLKYLTLKFLSNVIFRLPPLPSVSDVFLYGGWNISEQVLEGLTSLKNLVFNDYRFENGETWQKLKSVSSLKSISLEFDRKWLRPTLQNLSELPYLEKLKVDHWWHYTPVSLDGLRLTGFTALQTLHLIGEDFANSMHCFPPLPSLRHLLLKRIKLSSEDFSSLSSYRLTTLQLICCKSNITNQTVFKALRKMSSLRFLALCDVHFRGDGESCWNHLFIIHPSLSSTTSPFNQLSGKGYRYKPPINNQFPSFKAFSEHLDQLLAGLKQEVDNEKRKKQSKKEQELI